MKHTTGQWEVWEDSHEDKTPCFAVYGQKQNGFAAIVKTIAMNGEPPASQEAEANIKLISAAPDLLRAAHNAIVTLDAMNRLIATTIATETRKELESAIKKATE